MNKKKETRTSTSFVKRVKEDEQEQEEINFTSIQITLYEELNNLRKNPKSYIPLIESQMNLIKNKNILKQKDSNLQIQTLEGKAAYEEAISFLQKQKPVSPLTKEMKLSYAAKDLVQDIGERGVVTHQDKEGQFTSERIEKYCEWDSCANELIEVSSQNPQDILISLIVDDGFKNRPNRRALFKSDYKYVGISCGPHSEYEIVTVFVFAGGIRQKGTLFNQKTEYEYRSSFDNYNFGNNENNLYLINDPDAPKNSIGLRITKARKYLGKNIILVTKKFYKLDNGTQHVVELEEY